MDKPLSYRELRRILSRFGVREVLHGRGSHRKFVGWFGGVAITYPIPVHKESQVYPQSVIKSVRRALPESGTPDKEFYG